jgi:redox-sensitive bicupin YhaK (pirin superfamily)
MVIEGNISVANHSLGKRDAIGISEIEAIEIQANEDSQVLLMEVPMVW